MKTRRVSCMQRYNASQAGDQVQSNKMDRVDVTLNLPQELVERARLAGLLSEEQIERWLNEELDRQTRLNRLFTKLDRLAEIEPAMTEDEILAEIDAYRRENTPNRMMLRDTSKQFLEEVLED